MTLFMFTDLFAPNFFDDVFDLKRRQSLLGNKGTGKSLDFISSLFNQFPISAFELLEKLNDLLVLSSR